MKAYLLISGVKISPFDQPPGTGVRVLNRSLVEYQTHVLSRLKIDVVPVTDISQIPQAPAYGHLVILDHVFFTHRAMTSFLKEARMIRGDSVLALPDSAFCREKKKLQDDLIVEQNEDGKDIYVTGVFLMKDVAGSLEELRDRSRRVVIPFKEKVHRPPNVEVLGLAENWDISFALTRDAVLHVCHWSHILDIHFVALLDHWLDLSIGRVFSYVWRFLTAFSLNKYKIARRFTYKGRRCDIHPTAVVEGSILGDGVKIGPYAIVRGSVIGNGVKIDEHAEVMFSAVGDSCVCAWRSRANFSVLYPKALVSYPAVQTCVIGEGAAQTGGSYPIDMKLDFVTGNTEVPVLHHGKVTGSGKQFLGCCLGHGSVVGTGVWMTCGLELPNGGFLVRGPEDVAKKIPGGVPPGEPMAIRNGQVVALRETKEKTGEDES